MEISAFLQFAFKTFIVAIASLAYVLFSVSLLDKTLDKKRGGKKNDDSA